MTGITQSDSQRYHFDIYAILEGAQEMYFGHEVQVNVNQVERVKVERTLLDDAGNLVMDESGNPRSEIIQKCYLSPTKRRGVERRALLWAPHKDGKMLGDAQACGIPKTCAKETCPICYVYGALEAGKNTLIGRVTHGGGVAVQPLDAEEKQRAMHPSDIVRGKGGETPTPFRREYNEPGLFYPVYNHALSVSETEFIPVAYAFLDSLARIGAGNPKGARLAEKDGSGVPLLVVDRYLVPKGKRPVVSPHETSGAKATEYFVRQAEAVRGNGLSFGGSREGEMFSRWTGDEALERLESWSETFVKTHLQ